MAQFTLIFTTRHRNGYAVERDCMFICTCITAFTINYKYIYNGKELIVFHIYGVNKENRQRILFTLCGHLLNNANYKSLDLQSYTMN